MFNVMDVIVMAIILISVFFGYKKGFVKSAISLLSFFVAIGLAVTFYKPLAIILTENTTIDDWIIEGIISSNNMINSEENLEAVYNSGDITQDVSTNAENEIGENSTIISNVFSELPAVITQNFNIEEIKNNAKEEIAYQTSELIMNLLSLIIIYVIVKTTLFVAMIVLNGIMQIPVLKQLNEILGMAFGAVIGFSQVYIAFAVITFISSICDIAVAIEMIKASSFASVLFENNVIINLLF